MTHLEIVPLEEKHLEEAAALAVAGYRRERRAMQELTERPENADEIVALLRSWLRRAPGVAALEDGKFVGYIVGLPVPELRGRHKGVYVAEWANAVSYGVDDQSAEGLGHSPDTAGCSSYAADRSSSVADLVSGSATGLGRGRRDLIYRTMYEAISQKWLENGCLTHAVTVFAHDTEALGAWFGCCFGLLVVDAIRDLSPVSVPPVPGIEIRRATIDDLEQVVHLRQAHQRYMAQAPIFMPLLEFDSEEDRSEFLRNPTNVFLLAYDGKDPVAYIQFQARVDGTARAVHDPGTVACTGAYTADGYRRNGIGAAMLNRLIAEARSAGYRRLSVDFESFNTLGSRFWLKYFKPVCYSVIRTLDDRVLWAHKDRKRVSAW